jgi:hypothetical protein
VPSLLHVGEGGPPFWPRVVDAVRAGLDTSGQKQGVVLVAHSNAGLFIPVIAAALPGQVLGCIFVDAALPPPSGTAAVAPPELLALLRGKASGGLLPRWTDWWDEEEVAPLFPDPQTRQAVTEQQPRLPLSYYEASVPVPAGWDMRPCAYLLFGLPYDEAASWLTRMVSLGRCWRSLTSWGSPSPKRRPGGPCWPCPRRTRANGQERSTTVRRKSALTSPFNIGAELAPLGGTFQARNRGATSGPHSTGGSRTTADTGGRPTPQLNSSIRPASQVIRAPEFSLALRKPGVQIPSPPPPHTPWSPA